jgi:hypothetical protein
VLDVNAPYLLELRAKARPFGTAEVKLLLTPGRAGSTDVTMIETAGDAVSHLLFNPMTAPLVRLRNMESLRRLKRMAEARATVAADDR